MDSPKTIQKTSIGTYAGMGSVVCRPIRLAPQPHWKIATMTPYDAPIDRMFRTAALVGITTDRNEAMSRMNAIAITARITHTRWLVIWLVKSTLPATVPVT